MNKLEELKKLAESLGIKTWWGHKNEYFIMEGVNAGKTGMYHRDISNNIAHQKIFSHIHQMGRDSLKMELNRLLNPMTHA